MNKEPKATEMPAAASAPAPVQPMAAPQPQTQFAQPGQPVQYVVMQQSLKGVGGWLIFWMIVFSLAALGYIWAFFASMLTLNSATSIVALIFSPLLAAGFIAAVVLIAMQKRLAKLVTFITLGVGALYSVVMSIVGYATVANAASTYDSYYSSSYSSYSASQAVSNSLPLLIAAILAAVVGYGLVALYFILSRRVKETLVN